MKCERFSKSRNNPLGADQYVRLLASAEKAAGEKDEGKMLSCFKQIPTKARDIGKAVIPVRVELLACRGQ